MPLSGGLTPPSGKSWTRHCERSQFILYCIDPLPISYLKISHVKNEVLSKRLTLCGFGYKVVNLFWVCNCKIKRSNTTMEGTNELFTIEQKKIYIVCQVFIFL